MKPELTFRRSLRLISKRWWLLLLGGVLFAALAFLVAGQKKPHYVASADLGINDVTAVPLAGALATGSCRTIRSTTATGHPTTS